MSKHQHTPGPWSVSPADDTVVIDAMRREVAAIDGDYNTPDTWPQMEANARLIAAAPEMLDSLKDCVRMLEAVRYTAGLGKHQMERVERAKAAIAKAEGRSDA